MTTYKLGRKARRYDSRVPHMSALLAGQTLPPPPAAVDYTAGMPANLGTMLNTALGDCTCAGWGHADQVWTFNASGVMHTLPDSDIEDLYEACGGYVPGNPDTDNGCIEQDVLTYLMQTGLAGNKLTGFIEVDRRNSDDIKRTIDWCGLAYIGFEVPSYLLQYCSRANAAWDVPGSSGIPADADTSIEGGHCVILAGYDKTGYRVISWGAYYTMTPAFLVQYVDEIYGLIDGDWLKATGKTPCNMTLSELESVMKPLQHEQSDLAEQLHQAPTRDQLSWQLSAGVSQPVGGGAPAVSAGVSVTI